MCALACPRGAIRVSVNSDTPFEVVSLECNDCGKCAIVCPQRVLAPDPAWAACWGRGCPMSSRRYDEWSCSEGRRRCPTCNNALWWAPDASGWVCVRCDEGSRVICPKVRKAGTVQLTGQEGR
ncbi:MAG: hypothetical protein JJLCMIEE_00014 [Acidimicrobiales bacterium]|nr:hypothetical protein [Acidimicrobiales bacterium]